MRVPSGRFSVYERAEELCQYQDMTRCKDEYAHVLVHIIFTLTPVVIYTQPTLVVARNLRAHVHAIACLHRLHVLPHIGSCARDLMSDENRGQVSEYAHPDRRCQIG
jgi:hypothetical protein